MIETQRLIIRPWMDSDASDFLALSNDEGFKSFPITKYQQPDLVSAQLWIQQNNAKLAVFEKGAGLVGMGGLTPWILEDEELVDVTYRLRTSAWGRGLGMELAQALVDYGISQLSLAQITATITPDNVASKKIAEKLGMKFDKTIILLGVPTELYRLIC